MNLVRATAWFQRGCRQGPRRRKTDKLPGVPLALSKRSGCRLGCWARATGCRNAGLKLLRMLPADLRLYRRCQQNAHPQNTQSKSEHSS